MKEGGVRGLHEAPPSTRRDVQEGVARKQSWSTVTGRVSGSTRRGQEGWQGSGLGAWPQGESVAAPGGGGKEAVLGAWPQWQD